jgi:5'-nucleotidase
MMAGIHIMKDSLPDLVISGVNRGFNVADDVTYSGTVAAAMEGTVLGIASVALSQAVGGREDEAAIFACAARHGPPLMRRLVEIGWPESVLLNINFPPLSPGKVKTVQVTSQGQRDQSMLRLDERVDARGRTYYWVGFKRVFSEPEIGTDLHAIAHGCISVTPLHLDLTALQEKQRLETQLDVSVARLSRQLRQAGRVQVKRKRSASGRFRRAEK